MAKVKFYYLPSGVKGWVEKEKKWMLFVSYEEYMEYIEEEEE